MSRRNNITNAFCLLGLLLAGSQLARAQDDTIALPDLVQGAQQWAQENLDTNFLNALPAVDEQTVQQFFRDMQQRFQGDYVVDLASLRQTAHDRPAVAGKPRRNPALCRVAPGADGLSGCRRRNPPHDSAANS